jgi:hypothetical protein
MSVQLVVVLVLVALAALYFGRGFVLGLMGRGACASGGCEGCGEGGCTLKKLEELRHTLEQGKTRP